MKLIKPLLATKVDYSKVRYPVLATPKLDGIRCLTVDKGVMSRSMKSIPNHFIREQLSGLHGLDGELMINGDFNDVQSGVMKQEGKPDFTYWVFDSFLTPEQGYTDRLHSLYESELEWNTRIQLLLPIEINNREELDGYLNKCLKEGYEGVMIRDPNGKYKFGRSTVNEGILLKLKTHFDDEGTLVEITEQMHNENETEKDELGYSKRSSCKENLVPANTAGSLTLEWQGKRFKVGFGPGIDEMYKKQMWDLRNSLINNTKVKFRYQELSKDGIPRFGKMLCFRHDDDL